MDTLILENFRCFAGRHEVPLRPLTLLVGENSTGKTSFLAANQVVREAVRLAETPDFNRQPYDLGAYNEIATFRAGRVGKSKSFLLGFKENQKDLANREFNFGARFVESEGLPTLSHWEASIDGVSVSIRIDGMELLIERKTPTTKRKSTSRIASPWRKSDFFWGTNLLYSDDNQADKQAFGAMIDRIQSADIPYASAPVRADPKRTYDLTSDKPKPQGNHVPVLLSQIYGSDEWGKIEMPLLDFAKSAGLFERISVKRLGNGQGGPFQLQVRLSGHPRNIIDVGYGVSQVLPVVFDAVRGPRNQSYMFQQPEVHLHPRAQAELGTLFGSLVKAQQKQFIIETHSDYLLDRVRFDVRDKKNLRPEDVVILYFERRKDGVKIFPIFLDEMGHLIDTPPTYRQFFLEEERRFWGLD